MRPRRWPSPEPAPRIRRRRASPRHSAPVRERSQGRLWVRWRCAAPEFLRRGRVAGAGQTVPRRARAKEYHLEQKAAGLGQHAILRALAFEWVRILRRCRKDEAPDDDARHQATVARRRSPLANAASNPWTNPCADHLSFWLRMDGWPFPRPSRRGRSLGPYSWRERTHRSFRDRAARAERGPSAPPLPAGQTIRRE